MSEGADMMEYAVVHEKGEREYQEDSVSACGCRGIKTFWVADGLGGHGRGKEASQMVVDHCGECLREGIDSEDYFRDVFVGGNGKLLARQDQLKNTGTMKTTLVGCLLRERELTWAHMGDSRFYLFQGEKMAFRSLDHSVPQMLALGGEIRESEIRNHPDRNRVLRVLGSRDGDVSYERGPAVLAEAGMKALLCTDGFWEWITEQEMEELLGRSKSAQEWLGQMKERVQSAGRGRNMDNYTALGIWF